MEYVSKMVQAKHTGAVPEQRHQIFALIFGDVRTHFMLTWVSHTKILNENGYMVMVSQQYDAEKEIEFIRLVKVSTLQA